MAAFLEIPENIWENYTFKKIVKNLVYVVFVIYFVMMLTIIANDKNALDEKKNALYLTSVIVPMIVFAYIIFSNLENKKYLVLVVIMVLAILIALLRSTMPSFDKFLRDIAYNLTSVNDLPPLSREWSFLITIITKLLLILIIVVALSIIFNIVFNETFRQRGKLGIILYAIFYIPCLVSDYIKYLYNEITTTPLVVYTLLVLEIILILLYIYVPKLISRILFRDNSRVQKDPVFLNIKQQIGDVTPFLNRSAEYKALEKEFNLQNADIDEKDPDVEPYPNKQILRNYAVSLWVTVNPPSLAENEECLIFRVGKDLGTLSKPDEPSYGAPYIACKANKWKFVYSNNVTDSNGKVLDDSLQAVSIELDLPYQRWNHIVFNYHDNQVDLFINGILRDTKQLNPYLPKYSYDQVICTGSDTRRIHGAICEVRVHQENLEQTEISQSYNLLKLMNPPVNNLY